MTETEAFTLLQPRTQTDPEADQEPTVQLRLKPTRAGIVNLWDYSDEEFAFADGRLALRGHNGSGKTKALEVLFPFVLDGSLDARRLDPFSGENRTMKANLLYRGQEAEHGYVWMEFAGRPADLAERGAQGETITLVIGLRAHKNWDRPRPSFYITDKRMGVDFGLLSGDSRPLTPSQLTALLGSEAYFGDKRGAYQDAVDGRLFGLGRERYTQLLDLLIALRRPLLAKDLDPVKVSETLTAGLSPVDEDLVDQAARDFENLAAVQKQYDDLAAADSAVREFVTQYTGYLRVHTRDQLDQLDSRIQAVGTQASVITSAATEVARAQRAERTASAASRQAEQEVRKLQARINGLRNRDAYSDHEKLAIRRAHVDQEARELAAQQARLATAVGNAAELEQEAAATADRLAELGRAADRHLRGLVAAAQDAGVCRDGEPADTGSDLAVTAKSRVTVRREDIRVVRQHLAEVRDAERDRGTADSALGRAAEAVTARERACRAAEAELARSQAELAGDLAAWARRWTGEEPFAVIIGSETEQLTGVLDQIAEPGAPTLAEAYVRLTQPRRALMITTVEQLRSRAESLAEDQAELAAERATVAAGLDDAPPPSDLRPADRTGRAGAPLWRLVRFADSIASEAAAAIEGALYGAGLLTAWVHPDPLMTSAALAAAEADGYLMAAQPDGRADEPAGPAGPGGRTLADILVVEEQELVPAAVTTAVLASISLQAEIGQQRAAPAGAAPVVTTRAQYSYGPHLGARPKAAPEFIGAANRASRRTARVGALDAAIADLGRRRDELAARLGRAEDVLADLDRAQLELPGTAGVIEAREKVAEAATLLVGDRARLDDARVALDAVIAELDARARRLRRAAADHDMTATGEAVDAVEEAVAEFERAVGELVRARSAAASTTADLAGRRARIDRLTGENVRFAEQLELRQAAHLAEAEELSVLEGATGPEYQKISQELTDADQSLRAAEAAQREAAARAADEREKLIGARKDFEHGSGALMGAVTELLARAHSFGPYAQPGLRPLLGVTEAAPWPASSQWPTAEQVTAALIDRLGAAVGTGPATRPADVDDAAEPVGAADPAGSAAPAAPTGRTDPAGPAAADGVWVVLPEGASAVLTAFTAATRGGRAVTEGMLKNAVDRMWSAYRDFENALKTGEDGYQADMGGDAPFTVDVATSAGRFPVAAFAQKISEDMASQRVLLEERERTVLEDSLLTALARQIHARVIAARDLVSEMDADMRSKPMSSGTAIGIGWVRADNLTERETEVSRLLDRDAANLGPDRLADLRALLRAMIHEHRAKSPRDTYREALGSVLDYRSWHAFELRMLQPGQPAQRLTRKKHSEMSGGEKSAAIHLPLFAAANALYSSSKPTCPRLVALDEAFAGIDDRFKPELLGLTVKFDLDLFMTGHDLWVTYPTVPMIAHYDMQHDKSAHAVSTLLALWDGGQLVDAGAGYAGNEDLAAELLGYRPTRYVPADATGIADVLAVPSAGDEDDEQDDPE